MSRILLVVLLCGSFCAVACQQHDGRMPDAERAALAEKWRLVNERHMPCQPEVVAAILDGYLARSARAVTAKLVPIRDKHRLYFVWVIGVDNRIVEAVSGPLPEIATRPADGPASIAVIRSRKFIAEHFDRRGRLVLKDEPPVPSEHLSAEYQQRVYGVQIVAVELLDPDRMRWKVTAAPARKGTMGGEIWMRFTPESRVSAEFGR